MSAKKINNIIDRVFVVLSSRWFLVGVIVLFVIQASWIALSFRYPLIYDEIFHVPVIEIYSQQISPFITNQPVEYDQYGNLAHNAAGLYHYLMSFPFRLAGVFTDNFAIKVIILRMLNIALAATGLYLFHRLFKKAGIKQGYINVALLVFVLIPLVPFISAHVNYDNMLFPLTALYLLLCVRILKDKKVEVVDYLGLIALACFTSLIKFTFLPVLAVTFLYIAIVIWGRYGKKFFERLVTSVRQTNRQKLVVVTIGVLLAAGLFAGVYIQNFIRYGNPRPNCQATMSKERCLAQPLTQRSEEALRTKNKRPKKHVTEYVTVWYNAMALHTVMTGGNTTLRVILGPHFPTMKSLLFFGVIVVSGAILYAWHSMNMNKRLLGFLLIVSLTVIVSVFIQNYTTYLKFHIAFAIQPRYLLTVIPIILVVAALAAGLILKHNRYLKVLGLAFLLMIFSQGGGAITHVLLSDHTWYWQNPKVINANESAQQILKPLVKEK